jgi:hypothetical protein
MDSTRRPRRRIYLNGCSTSSRYADRESMNAAARKLLRSAMSQPWWQVRWDAQVGLHLDCGTPRLETDGMWQRRVLPRGAKKLVARRVVRVLGTHWLWFAPQTWRIALADGLTVSDKSSVRSRDHACARLKGEMLVRVRIDVATGASAFEFDLGSSIAVRAPQGTRSTSRNRLELWSLHCPRERFVAGYAGGYYSSGSTRGQDPPPVPLAPQSREGREIVVESPD